MELNNRDFLSRCWLKFCQNVVHSTDQDSDPKHWKKDSVTWTRLQLELVPGSVSSRPTSPSPELPPGPSPGLYQPPVPRRLIVNFIVNFIRWKCSSYLFTFNSFLYSISYVSFVRKLLYSLHLLANSIICLIHLLINSIIC